jgi:DNA polymerase-3 subunit delta
VKATQSNFGGMAAKAAAQAHTFFFCGPDEAGASAAAARIVELLPDAGERVEIAGADLRKDPVRLGDEARSGSLFGDARHIMVRAHGEEAHDALANHLDGEGQGCPVIVVATGATDKSRTAKLLANRDDCLVGMFYLPDLRTIAGTVREMADANGVQMNSAIAERIARGAGLDVRLAASEVEKLALYLDASTDGPRTADAATLDAIGAESEEDGFGPLVDAVLGGKTKLLASELRRMRELGLNAVAVLLALERRAAQLAALAARLGGRGDVTGFIAGEKAARRIFFKDENALRDQLSRWRGKRLERLVDRLASLHQDLMANSQHADLLLSQGLADITRFAARKA